MKIYTKKGDKGFTDLIKKRVSKTDTVIWINGTLDELTSYLSFSKIHINDNELLQIIDSINKTIHLMSYEMAGGPKQINDELVVELENYIDYFDKQLPPLKEFIKFDKNVNSSLLNISRTIARKAERFVIYYNQENEVNEKVIKYLNRLSDLLFVMGRYLDKEN